MDLFSPLPALSAPRPCTPPTTLPILPAANSKCFKIRVKQLNEATPQLVLPHLVVHVQRDLITVAVIAVSLDTALGSPTVFQPKIRTHSFQSKAQQDFLVPQGSGSILRRTSWSRWRTGPGSGSGPSLGPRRWPSARQCCRSEGRWPGAAGNRLHQWTATTSNLSQIVLQIKLGWGLRVYLPCCSSRRSPPARECWLPR